MGEQRGHNTRLIIDTETIFKSNPSQIDAIVMHFSTETLRLNRPHIVPPTIRTSRETYSPLKGRQDVSGDINFILAPQDGRIFRHLFGTVAKSGGSGSSIWTYTYSIGNLPTSMVIEKQFLDIATPQYALYNGCRINRFNFSVKSEGFVECSVGILGAKETIGTSSFDTTPTDLGHTAFQQSDVTIKQGGVTATNISDFAFTVENNLDGGVYVIDTTSQRYALPEGQIKVTGTFTEVFDSITRYNLAVADTETALQVILQKGTGAGSSGNEKLTFNFDEVKLVPKSPVISGPAGVMVEFEFTAYYTDDAEKSSIWAELLAPISAF